jgi:hypothetical protein
MHEIDFLPEEHRRRYVQRQTKPWRVVVVVVFLALLATAVLTQLGREKAAEGKLARILPQYELAVSQNRRLTEIHAELDEARDTAELLTYLRHPWPRTQLLAALLAPLPEEINLDELRISYNTLPEGGSQRRDARNEETAEDKDLAKLSPSARDLKHLRDQCDQGRTIVMISGTSNDSAAVYGYLSKLSQLSLFSAADADWIKATADRPAGTLRFLATVVVRPGYGQPGGPMGPDRDTIARNMHPGR